MISERVQYRNDLLAIAAGALFCFMCILGKIHPPHSHFLATLCETGGFPMSILVAINLVRAYRKYRPFGILTLLSLMIGVTMSAAIPLFLDTVNAFIIGAAGFFVVTCLLVWYALKGNVIFDSDN